MAIIGNPWAQDVASFGQQTGNSLAQALIGLPQQRYEMALRQQELRRSMQQMQNQSQYHNELLGLRQQGLNNQSSAMTLANQIRALQLTAQKDHYGVMENRPISLGGGNVLVPQGGGSGQGEATQQGMMGNPPNPQQLPQSGQEYGGFRLINAGNPRNAQPATGGQQLTADTRLAELYPTMLQTSMTNNPGMMNMYSNVTSQALQRLGGMGQQQQQPMPQQGMGMGTNSLTQPQQQPQQPQGFDTNAIMQQAMQAIQAGANPQAVHQRLQQQYGLSLQ